MANRTTTNAKTRTERYSMGEMTVPAHVLYGASTQRAVLNFPVSGRPVPPQVIGAFALLKKACAETNVQLGRLVRSPPVVMSPGHVDYAASICRCVFAEITLSAFTEAISRLSMIAPALVVRIELVTNNGIATIKPKAVVFIATEILADSRSAFSAGFAFATAVNAWMRPMMVPSRPSNVAMLDANAT